MTHLPTHLIIAFYHLTKIDNPRKEVERHREFLLTKDAASRIYISEEGINCQMSATYDDAHAYMDWLAEQPHFDHIRYKIDGYHEHVFPKLSIKYRKQLVAFDVNVDFAQVGEHLSPKAWRDMLEKNEGHVLLDIRNDYEWEVGHFEGADKPPCQTSRGFMKYARELKEKVDPKKTPIMMYCTGGIRCELFSSILKQDGFEKVYQLEGGVINYGHQQGASHWLGKLFVFDDRMVTPIAKEEAPVIGKCHSCQAPCDAYYNCASMDCNTLFLCCSDCLKQHSGCCSTSCMTAPRIRPYHHQNPHKPFRKWYAYFSDKAKNITRASRSDKD